MEQGILNLYKLSGETPLECLTRFKREHPEYADVPMTYAGRLDPLAEGVLLVLAGEARFRREEFLALPKTYEFEILWGFASDTYDVLGIAEFKAVPPGDIEMKCADLLRRYRGDFDQAYPMYSSKTVDGVPLFVHAREGKASGSTPKELPSKNVHVESLEIIRSDSFEKRSALECVQKKIESVRGDFRQAEACASWARAFSDFTNAGGREVVVTKLSAAVSSGTYVRGIAHALGKDAGCGALAWNIKRTAIGSYKMSNSLGNTG
jgi:tRNA pseudouridine(55) synthase